MLTNPQKALLKQAQREANISDEDYRDALMMIANVTTSTAPEIDDRHLDKLLAYFEAIHWRQPGARPTKTFSQPGFWANRNTADSTTRDRFVQLNVESEIGAMELKLRPYVGHHYCAAIRKKIKNPYHYLAALKRTLAAKQKAKGARPAPVASGNIPF